jgi:integrase/recombinase XerD
MDWGRKPLRLASDDTQKPDDHARWSIAIGHNCDAMDIDELITEWLANPQFRPRTRDSYQNVLRKIWRPWMVEHGITLEDMDQRALDRWVVHLQTEGGPRGPLAPRSVLTYGRTVNHFLNWARRERALRADAKARPPRPDRKLLVVLTRAEIQRLEDTATAERDKLIIRTLADTGIRLEELLGLRPDSLVRSGAEHYLRVMGKGGRERDVPILGALYTRLRRYADHGRPRDAATTRLFVGLKRRPDGTYAALTSRGVQLMLHSTAEQAGIRKRVHPHLLRHSYATWMIRKGRNLISLQGDMGHRSLAMLQGVYSHLAPGDRHHDYMEILSADPDEAG